MRGKIISIIKKGLSAFSSNIKKKSHKFEGTGWGHLKDITFPIPKSNNNSISFEDSEGVVYQYDKRNDLVVTKSVWHRLFDGGSKDLHYPKQRWI